MSVNPYPQTKDPTIKTLEDLVGLPDTAPYFSALDQAALMSITPFARTLLDDPDQASMWATLGLETLGTVGGGGVAEKVAFWSNEDTLTADTDLHYDSTNSRLGIGTSTPTSRLHVEGTEAYSGGTGTDFTAAQHLSFEGTLSGAAGQVGAGLWVRSRVNLAGFTSTSHIVGLNAQGIARGAGSVSNLEGLRAYATNEGTGTVSEMAGLVVPTPLNTGGGTITTYTGVIVRDSGAVAPAATSFYSQELAGAGRWSFYASAAHAYFGGYVGIGTTTLTAPLTFPASVGQKLHLYASGNLRYGLGIASGAMQIYSATNAQTQIGAMSTTDGTTFTPRLSVNDGGADVTGNLSVTGNTGMTRAVPTLTNLRTGYLTAAAIRIEDGDLAPRHGIDCPREAYIASLGVWYAPPTNVALRTWTAAADSLSLGRGDTVARWPLDCNGSGHVLSLGVYYAPSTNVVLRAWTAAIDSLSLNRGDTAARWQLDCEGQGYINRLGVTYAPDNNYSLRAGSTYLDALTVAGTLYESGAATFASSLRVDGDASLRGPYTGITGWADSRWNLTVWGTSYFNGTMQCGNYVGFGGVPDNRFNWRSYGNIYLDGAPYNGGGGPWVAWSDRRLKHNIQEIPHPLATMCTLHGVLYEYNDTDMGRPAGLRMGVIAQEVEQIVPDWVGELDGMKTTQLSKFEALTIESFKELAQRVAALEDRL